MTIHEQLKKELPESMKARDEVRTRTIRALLTALTNESVRLGNKPDQLIEDDAALPILKRAANQRKESVEQFEQAGRADLAAHEREELTIIETYLPEMLGKEEIERIAQQKQEELGITDPSKKGMLIGAIMKEVGAKADGGVVKEVVENLFA